MMLIYQLFLLIIELKIKVDSINYNKTHLHLVTLNSNSQMIKIYIQDLNKIQVYWIVHMELGNSL
jgi:hypothetical protein